MKNNRFFNLAIANILSGLLVILGAYSCKSNKIAKKEIVPVCKYGIPQAVIDLQKQDSLLNVIEKAETPDTIKIKDSSISRPVCKYGIPNPSK